MCGRFNSDPARVEQEDWAKHRNGEPRPLPGATTLVTFLPQSDAKVKQVGVAVPHMQSELGRLLLS
jgi:hypothetical protein